MKKPVVIFVHGWGTDNDVWMNQAAAHFLPGFEKRFVELPGHGKSSRQWDKATLDTATDVICDAIDGLDRPVSAVGWSLGAMILMATEAKRPGTFEKLVLVGATPCFVQKEGFEHGQPKPLVRRMIMDMKAAPGATLAKFLRLNFTPVEMESEAVLNYLNKASQSAKSVDHASIVAALETLYNIDLTSEMGGIKSKTLIIHGSDDAVTPVGAARRLCESIQSSSLHVFDLAGHAPHLSCAGFNSIVEKFLA